MKKVISYSCDHCGEVYDRTEFGAGIKYCSPKCRQANAATARVCKTRFPRARTREHMLIVQDLLNRGFELHTPVPSRPNRLIARKGVLEVRVCVGGGDQPGERWAQSVAYTSNYPFFSSVKYASTCAKGQPRTGSTAKTGVTAAKRPCGVCKSCRHFHWFAIVEHLPNAPVTGGVLDKTGTKDVSFRV